MRVTQSQLHFPARRMSETRGSWSVFTSKDILSMKRSIDQVVVNASSIWEFRCSVGVIAREANATGRNVPLVPSDRTVPRAGKERQWRQRTNFHTTAATRSYFTSMASLDPARSVPEHANTFWFIHRMTR